MKLASLGELLEQAFPPDRIADLLAEALDATQPAVAGQEAEPDWPARLAAVAIIADLYGWLPHGPEDVRPARPGGGPR